ncbi:LmbU family transcriptional regulator [Nocardia sp. NRRL S-836]|uniref:LmbU family transcriptional regulator n=1 Tax=Nocardia sp. NRRL S-836 TaxID=1519492 RepID=UPI0006AFDA68|nr:LmbU family transcriptional regulator [Nocardia sp. NRRL S-836]KOV82378.1 hypothetical protein ADL03_25285 [Nocardia sp. NRRL S-836]
MTRVGLRIPSALSFAEWERAGRRLAELVDSSAWSLGDWLVFGKEHYSDRYQHAVRAVGLSYQTLRNYAWVAGRFDLTRRRPALTFQHHAEVASLPPDVQEYLLSQAETNSWTTRQLRSAIRGGNDAGNEVVADSRITVPQDRVETWRQAADVVGQDFEKWLVTSLDQAAERTLRSGQGLRVVS